MKSLAPRDEFSERHKKSLSDWLESNICCRIVMVGPEVRNNFSINYVFRHNYYIQIQKSIVIMHPLFQLPPSHPTGDLVY